MKTITIDIINNKAVKLIEDLEKMQLIRIRREKLISESPTNWISKYKGRMTKQPLIEIDNQLNELRNAWD